MNCENVLELLQSGKEMYQRLLTEATDLLRNLDTCGISGYEGAVDRRQQSILRIQEIDTLLAGRLERQGGGLTGVERQALAEFMTLKETATVKILELDALVIALTESRLGSLKDELLALTKGKAAYSGYEKSGRCTRRDFNSTA